MIKNNEGFTLIELMLVISLIGIVLLIAGNIVNYNITTKYNFDRSYYECKINGRYAMNRIVNEIKNSYNTSFTLGKITGGVTTLVNSNENDMTGNIQFYYEADTYGIGDGYGELRDSNGAVLAKYIKDFTIEDLNPVDPNLVKVTVKSQKGNSKRAFEIVTYIRLYD